MTDTATLRPLLNRAGDFAPFEGRVWLNCAHQAPLPRCAAEAAREAVSWKERPWELTTARFTGVPQRLREALARLIGAASRDVILANSASYGLHLLANGGLPLRHPAVAGARAAGRRGPPAPAPRPGARRRRGGRRHRPADPASVHHLGALLLRPRHRPRRCRRHLPRPRRSVHRQCLPGAGRQAAGRGHGARRRPRLRRLEVAVRAVRHRLLLAAAGASRQPSLQPELLAFAADLRRPRPGQPRPHPGRGRGRPALRCLRHRQFLQFHRLRRGGGVSARDRHRDRGGARSGARRPVH